MTQGSVAHRLVIRPTSGWPAPNLAELWAHRELLFFLAWRDVKVRYAQTALGVAWAILQPLTTVAVFTIIFGRVARIGSSGLPYAVFSMAGLMLWGFFTAGLGRASGGLVASAGLITKVYFPRLIIPIAPIISALPDLVVGLLVLAALMFGYSVAISSAAPLFFGVVFLTGCAGVAVGLWVSALTVRYRDLQHLVPFLTQIGLYVTPVIYPAEAVTTRLEALGIPGWLYGLNPMAGLVAAGRSILFGTTAFPLPLFLTSISVTGLTLVSGLFVFRRMERDLADLL